MTRQVSLPGMGTVKDFHDFQEKLQYANFKTRHMRLEKFYMGCFPDILTIAKVQDIDMQRQGIDTMALLKSNKIVYFDEKVRSQDYGDILLEEYSVWKNYPMVDGRKVQTDQPVPYYLEEIASKSGYLKRGWLSGMKKTDYIVYIVAPSKKVFFLPFLLLRRAWAKYYRKWLGESERLVAQNANYVTTNIAVPIDTLYEALYETAKW